MQKYSPSAIIFPAALLLWALAALGIRDMAPWLFWISMILLPATIFTVSEWDFLKSSRGRQILLICLGLLIAHVGWAVIRSQSYDAANPVTYWRDDHNYFKEATALAAAWSEGHYPEFWRKGSPPYLGTLHTGYHRPLSTLFLLAGPSTVVGLLLNAFCASLFPLLTAVAAKYLWTGDNDKHTPQSRDPSLIAAILTALHPTQFYWSSYLLKDVFVAFVFLISMAMLLGAWRRRSPAYGIGCAMLLPYLFTIRIYAALSLASGAVCLPVLRMRKQSIVIAAAACAAAVFLFCAYTLKGHHIYSQMRDSIVALVPSGDFSTIDIATQIFVGIPRLFLAPYAWLLLETPTPMYGMYPGMWYLYLIGYPLAFSGFYAALRKNIKGAVVPIAAFGLASLLFLTATFEGDASRQRFYLEYVILLFAAYGFIHPSKWWISGILVAEAAFAFGQLLSLR